VYAGFDEGPPKTAKSDGAKPARKVRKPKKPAAPAAEAPAQGTSTSLSDIPR